MNWLEEIIYTMSNGGYSFYEDELASAVLSYLAGEEDVSYEFVWHGIDGHGDVWY